MSTTDPLPDAGAVPGRYRTREPVSVDAIRYTGDNDDAMAAFAGSDWTCVPPGCYVVKGVTGHFFTVDADRFAATYEPADGTAGRVPEARDGAAMIRAERLRQVAIEGYDAHHGDGDLIRAAVAYATAAVGATGEHTAAWWPFDLASFKPGEPLDSLVKAGALIAAGIDRIVARCKVCDAQVDAVMAAVEEEAVNRMAGQLVAESRLRSLQVRDGRISLEAEPAREIAAMWAGAVRTLLDGAENYAEIEMEFKPAGTVERYAFTLQRVGKLTPHQARRAAEARADAAEAKLAAITAELKACMAGFFTHYGNSTAASLNLARDLAEGIRQILDRDSGGTGEQAAALIRDPGDA